MNSKRPDKIKLDVVKPPSNIHFAESLGVGKKSMYKDMLMQAINSDSVIRILRVDTYLSNMFKAAAKKSQLRLVYGQDGEYLFIKPVSQTEAQKRLMLLLREPRTVNELAAAKLELHVADTLAQFARQGLAHIHKDKWVLTEAGFDSLNKAGNNGTRS